MLSGAFEAVVLLLRETQYKYKEIADPVFDRILNDAYQLSLSCMHHNEKKDWHEQALSKARQEENRLMVELTFLLDFIEKHSNLAGQDVADKGSVEILHTKMAEQRHLIQQINRLLVCSDTVHSGVDSSIPSVPDPRVSTAEHRDPVSVSLPGYHPVTSVLEDCKIKTDQNVAIFPSLVIYFLGTFRVFGNDRLINGWPNCKGKSIFKYLATHREHPVVKELLMETFWPNSSPEAARNNLNVTIFGLRKALSKENSSFSHVLFQNGCYFLNPELNIWIDSEVFDQHLNNAQLAWQSGNYEQAIEEYRIAQPLYQAGFLVEDRYEDWLFPLQQHFRERYIKLLEQLGNYCFDLEKYTECVSIYTDELNVDNCNENVHRKLMVCYSRSGQPHLALRQYHICVETMTRELDMSPALETVELFRKIKRRETV